MRTLPRVAGVTLACIALTLGGCGPRINHGEVRGQVTIDGQPVTAGNVLFVSEDGQLTSTAPLNGDGAYVMKEAPIGKVRIAVQTLIYRGAAAPPTVGRGGGANQVGSKGMVLPDPSVRGLVYKAIPEKYEKVESSGLSAEVVKGDQKIDISLTWK